MKKFLAAIITLTRLPLGRIIFLDLKYYQYALSYWPLVGFISGGLMAGVLYLSLKILPIFPACLLTITTRIMLTGAMHEDGLADFFDGFGGGKNKEQILKIMKDSHIGTYGTISLILYFLLIVSFMCNIEIKILPILILIADIFSKLCASILINTIPYVRKIEESKLKICYIKPKIYEVIIISLISLIPIILIIKSYYIFALIPAIIFTFLLRIFLLKKIGGYTGDCCGASVLLIELIIYFSFCIISSLFN